MAAFSSLVGLAVGGKYEVRRVLGAGGMGVVCEAIHADLGKKVALKLIDKSMKESELIVARFRREARALGQIQSEHIVEVFDVGADPRVGLYMVMEHLSGEDLQSRLEREKKLEVKTGVMLAHQIARGLAKAHAAGVVHRDLKPANVFLTKRDNGQMLVKLLDFGVSKLLADEGGARITGSGAPIGTPLYMSPEQAEGRDDTDARADIWSLGAVMYEALAGTPPFPDRGSYHGTIVGILTLRPKLLHDAAPWVPPELAKVIDAMLVHDRDARIKSAEVVTQRLLDAFPQVLPDGTGNHTAVIVSQGAASIDTTGDTEFFSSQSMPSSLRGPRSSTPNSQPALADTQKELTPPPDIATRTAAATPIDVAARDESISRPPVAQSSKRPKTDPMPPGKGGWGAASSSAGGVSMPETPPLMEPLPMSVVPDTMRDDRLAVRAERRRTLTFAVIGAAIIAVAVLGFLVGRRANTVTPPPPVSATPSAPTVTPSAAPTTAPSTSPQGTATPTSQLAPSVPASSLPTASASGATRVNLKRRGAPPPKDEPAPMVRDPNAPDEKPPENPYTR